MLETILAISGKPGLYKLVSRGNNNLIVETIDAQKKRFPAFAADKVISLADIAMYTDEKEVPLREVLNSIKTKEGGKVASIDYRKASKEELFAYLGEVLPNFDRDRVYPADATGVPFDANCLAVSADPIADLTEDLAAEQKARAVYDNILRVSDNPDVNDVIKFLRQREIVHFQRFGEALDQLQNTPQLQGFCPGIGKK